MKSLNIPNWTRKIKWSNMKDLKELPSSKSWSRSILPPQENELRIVYVPEKTVTTDPFYGIFEPGLSFFKHYWMDYPEEMSGASFKHWMRYPEEIDLHRIYKAQIIETLFEDEQGKWVKVRIIESKKLSEVGFFLDSHYSTDTSFIRNYRYGDYSQSQHQKWLLISWSCQDALGQDVLLYEDDEYFILVYQYDWGFTETEETTIHNMKYKKETMIKRYGRRIFKYES
jgi:hypothetical protein